MALLVVGFFNFYTNTLINNFVKASTSIHTLYRALNLKKMLEDAISKYLLCINAKIEEP